MILGKFLSSLRLRKKWKYWSLSHVRVSRTPQTVARQAPLSMGLPRQEYWSGLPFPSPGDLPHSRIEPRPPALGANSLPSEPFSNGVITVLYFISPSNSQQLPLGTGAEMTRHFFTTCSFKLGLCQNMSSVLFSTEFNLYMGVNDDPFKQFGKYPGENSWSVQKCRKIWGETSWQPCYRLLTARGAFPVCGDDKGHPPQ